MAGSHNQPQYDLLTGAEIPASNALSQSRREPLTRRLSVVSKSDATSEEWRTQIHKLKYELDSLRQEREATAIRHEDEIRRVQSKAETDYKRAQAAEHASHAAAGRYSKAEQELRDVQERAASTNGDLEKKLRALQETYQTAQEEIEDLKSAQSSGDRKLQHDYEELQANYKSLQSTVEEEARDRDEKANLLTTANQRLSQRESEVGGLENEILRLKAQTGDVETLEVIKRELSDQVEHIKKLEGANLDQRIELKQLRKQQKSVEVVEEEKRVLESKLRIMDDLRKQLSEAQLQKQILEDEKRSWTSYLENDTTLDDDTRFETPEQLAKAYIRSCAENAELVDKYGKVAPDLSAKDEVIRAMEDERTKLNEELNKARQASGPATDMKAKIRMERQRALVVKEVEYLRAQLKTYDDEQNEFSPEQYDEQKAKRIQELEATVDEHRKEVQKLHEELSQKENPADATAKSLKRPRDTAEDERLGELSRKNRALQDQLSKMSTARDLMQKELTATTSQLTSLKASSRTRILELRENPTSKAQAISSSMLSTLREENESLLARLASSSSTSTRSSADMSAPTATVDRLRLDLSEAKEAYASLQKKTDRLKKVWAAKSREWREAVSRILGWDFEFQPNGRVRITNNFNPGISEEEGGEGTNSIIFETDKGTMKCSGGPRSAFAASVDPEIRFWVDDKGEVPCLLATLTLKFWDDTTKAGKVI